MISRHTIGQKVTDNHIGASFLSNITENTYTSNLPILLYTTTAAADHQHDAQIHAALA
ncbi:hypothetical protein MPER_08112 [Moniliophthora perniciosa FA553]|nr:hypothetical protein MPER_08112 [Moniliophthora perniciosa FA553]